MRTLDGNTMYTKYTLVAIQPSRVDFQLLLFGMVESDDVVKSWVVFNTKGFFFNLHLELRSFFAQPSSGTFGTQMNQYDQLIRQTQTGSTAAMSNVT